jgi:zeta-carotene isomerase
MYFFITKMWSNVGINTCSEHGENFLKIKERTSIIPFQAILEGRQKLPPDYYKELLRAPYVAIAVGSIGAYLAHPYMQAGAALVKNTGLVEGGIFN